MSQKRSVPRSGLKTALAMASTPSISTSHSDRPTSPQISSPARATSEQGTAPMVNRQVKDASDIGLLEASGIRASIFDLLPTREEMMQASQQEGSEELDYELELEFKKLREDASNEAFASLPHQQHQHHHYQHQQQQHQQQQQQKLPILSTVAPIPSQPLTDRQGLAQLTGTSNGSEVSFFTGPGAVTANVVPGQDVTLSPATSIDTHNNSAPKKTKRILSQLDVNELIQMKISQLELASTSEEDEEKALAKAMKKIHKEVSQLVNGQEDHLGKVNVMQRKYLEMFQDMRKQERDHTKLKKKLELLQREKDLVYRDKERLQKTNEALMAERNHLLEEHLLVQQKAGHMAKVLEKASMDHQVNLEKQRALEENEISGLKKKLQGLNEQYVVREKHFNSVVKSKDLELRLAQAKLERQRQVAQQETAKVELLKSQLNTLTKTETELRKQLNVYVEKFKQVEETLNKSNALFQTFRKEMEAMSKKGSSLEKVNLAIRAKCDTMNRNILEMAEERTSHQKALEAANMKRIKLENLCRALHAERTALRKNLDIYEARYPGLINSMPTIAPQNGGGGENGTNADDTTLRTKSNTMARAFFQSAMSGVGVGNAGQNGGSDGVASSTLVLGPSLLSSQNGGVKQSRLGNRRASITSAGKLRQKQKQQHLQLLLHRCEQSSAGQLRQIMDKDECKVEGNGRGGGGGGGGGGRGGPDDHVIGCLCHKKEDQQTDESKEQGANEPTPLSPFGPGGSDIVKVSTLEITKVGIEQKKKKKKKQQQQQQQEKQHPPSRDGNTEEGIDSSTGVSESSGVKACKMDRQKQVVEAAHDCKEVKEEEEEEEEGVGSLSLGASPLSRSSQEEVSSLEERCPGTVMPTNNVVSNK
ncbi:hypothetical protein BGZ94_000447 [Podila epigama]|nr:hypothetical protein BGZ94_000447 [Podila epigama]